MKKKIFIVSAFFSIVTLATIGTKIASSENISSLGLMFSNMEALASDTEGGGSNYNICYFESKVVKSRTYYDCNDCKTKIYDEKGVGTYTKCFY